MNKHSRSISIGFLIVFFLFQFAVVVQADEFDLSPTPNPIDYQLPYPGLLPDHPFYFFRQIRDDIWGFFTSGALPKAEYDLMQADKDISATVVLVDKGKPDLAVTTLTESVTYFTDAIEKTASAKKQGMDITEFVKKLSVANKKHQEIAKGLAKNNPEKFAKLSKKVEECEKKVNVLQPHK